MRTALQHERRTPLAVPPETAFAWHARPGALQRLLPPWLRSQVLEEGALAEGARSTLRLNRGPFQVTWLTEKRSLIPGRGWSDVQLSGPFDSWQHYHGFEPGPDGGSLLVDRVESTLPPFLLPLRRSIERELARSFRYRHAVTAADLAQQAALPVRPLNVAVSGASGFIGRMLLPMLTSAGHRITRLVRHEPGEGEIQWKSYDLIEPLEALQGIDAVVHLAGENIARRWTKTRKSWIFWSRYSGTRSIAESIARTPGGPRILVSASAVGIYGDRGDELLSETSPPGIPSVTTPGAGFLPHVAQTWEHMTEAAEAAGVRVVRLRIGLPLSPAGGLLQRLLRPFRWGLGGKLGSGRQWMSWISADDLLGVFYHVLGNDSVRGPVNAVAPHPVRNAEFTAELARVLRRPAFATVPAPALRLLFGELADEAILASTRVAPTVLEQSGYRFRHPTLDAALRHVLGRP